MTPLDEQEQIGSLTYADRSALAYAVAAHILTRHAPEWETVPLLATDELEHLGDRIRGIATDMREAAGQRGLELLRDCQ